MHRIPVGNIKALTRLEAGDGHMKAADEGNRQGNENETLASIKSVQMEVAVIQTENHINFDDLL